MAPLNFEDKIKDKLEQRTIKPSENSWEKLATQLDQEEKEKKKGNGIWWYSLAAVFVGILVLTTVFYNLPGSDIETPQIVDRSGDKNQPKRIDIVKENEADKKHEDQYLKKESFEDNKYQNSVAENPKEKRKSIINAMPQEKPQQVVQKEVVIESARQQENQVSEVVQNNKENIEISGKEKRFTITSEEIQQKLEDVIAQVDQLQKTNTEVTDEEIEALLRRAQRDITSKKILQENKVSASALLQDVEEEIDETFKQRVFEALKSGFQKVKTAIAEREN